MLKTRNEMKNKANNTQEEEDKTKYRKMRNQTKKNIAQDKRNWLNDQMNKGINSSKGLWQAANKVMGKTVNNNILEINHEGQTTKDRMKIATILNNNFRTKIQKIKAKIEQPETPYIETLSKPLTTSPKLQFK